MASFDPERAVRWRPVVAVLLSYGVLHGVQGVMYRLGVDAASHPVATVAAAATLRALSPQQLRVGEERLPQRAPAYLAASAVLMLFLNLTAGLLAGSTGVSTERTAPQILTAAFLGVLVKPPLEEYLFRGLYMRAVSRSLEPSRYRWHLSVIICSLLFALWHPTSPILALLCSVILGELALLGRKTKHPLLLPTAAHGIYNAVLYAAELAAVTQ